MSEPVYSFGAWVRLRRRALMFTREQLAQQVGVVAATIRKLENDQRRPSSQVAIRLAQHLKLPVEHRETFVHVARGLLPADTLPLPTLHEAGIVERLMLATPRLKTDVPRGTVTFLFLFTEIVGSASLWGRDPSAMRAALARQDTLLRAAINKHAGYIFRAIGETYCAAFTQASDALAAASDAQRALQTEQWGTRGSLHIRMALHSGSAEHYEGDYFGLTLDRIARLLAIGHGGQILPTSLCATRFHQNSRFLTSARMRLAISFAQSRSRRCALTG